MILYSHIIFIQRRSKCENYNSYLFCVGCNIIFKAVYLRLLYYLLLCRFSEKDY